MRYRPFNRNGVSSSAITLAVPTLRENDAFKLTCAALEHGINSFEITAGDEAAAGAMARAIPSVGRRVLVMMLRVERLERADDLTQMVRAALHRSGAEYFDAVVLDEACAPTPRTLDQIEALKAARLVRMAGLASDSDAADQATTQPGFDLLSATYNIRSGWPERNRIKAAATHGLTVVGRNFHIDPAKAAKAEAAPKGLGRLFKKASPEIQRAYDFLNRTPGWTAEQISLTYALTEPTLATVRVETASAPLLEQLVGAVERQLPSSVATHIEVAHVATLSDAGAA